MSHTKHVWKVFPSNYLLQELLILSYRGYADSTPSHIRRTYYEINYDGLICGITENHFHVNLQYYILIIDAILVACECILISSTI